MTCIIVEDQPPAQRVLQKYIADFGGLELKGVYADALSALEFLRKSPIDLIFLDVHLPKLSGMDFLKILSSKPKVIMTTAFTEYAVEGYEYDVVDYLLKPFSFERFAMAVNKAIDQQGTQNAVKSHDSNKGNKSNIFIKSGTDYVNITFRDLLYIQADGDYSSVRMKETKHLVSQPMRSWIEILPTTDFIQVHKSYIVNIDQITKISGGKIIINNIEIPIGRTFKEKFLALLKERS